MSQRTIVITSCDGCCRSDYHDGATIVQEQRARHICADCVEDGKYICRLCRDVHGDENPCGPMEAEIAAGDAWWAHKDQLAAVRAANAEMEF